MKFRHIVFDMDGVLIDAQDWHYEALNFALELFGFTIDRERHLLRFDGLPTKAKLSVLSQEDGLPWRLHETISRIKQDQTLRIAAQRCFPRTHLLVMLERLKANGIAVGCATNSVRQTSQTMLTWAGIAPYLDFVVTNEDVVHAKPHPEIYLRSAKEFEVDPSKLLVFEDNQHGIASAKAAGCQVNRVMSSDDLTWDYVEEVLHGESG